MAQRLFLRFDGPVPDETRVWMKNACAHLRASGLVRETLCVRVFGLSALPIPKGCKAVTVKRKPRPDEFKANGLFGWFAGPEMTLSGKATIAIAGRAPSLLRRSRSLRCGHLHRTFAHELVHYEQWLRGMEPHHQGIERSTMRMLRVIAPGARVG